jgi:hypothetical protein
MTPAHAIAAAHVRWLFSVAAALLVVFPSLVLADTVVRGGIITNVISNGNNGQFQVTVTNPFNQAGTATISITLNNNDGSVTQTTVNVSISANGYGNSSISQMFKFNSATASAEITAGGSTDSGQAFSSVNGQPCGSAHQPACPQ